MKLMSRLAGLKPLISLLFDPYLGEVRYRKPRRLVSKTTVAEKDELPGG